MAISANPETSTLAPKFLPSIWKLCHRPHYCNCNHNNNVLNFLRPFPPLTTQSRMHCKCNNPSLVSSATSPPSATATSSSSSHYSPDMTLEPLQPHNSPSATTSWSEFAKNVSGEWDGFGADFSAKGKPIELPEHVVPEAFREWEVKMYDWQTQCPTLAQPDQPATVACKLIKLLPTVGCEADAATPYTTHHRNMGGDCPGSTLVSALAYEAATGCYVALWLPSSAAAAPSRLLELEHCLVDPRNRRSRIRIIQSLCVDEGGRIKLQKIGVFVEQWYGPFQNGQQLGGCAVLDSAFASTPALKASKVSGVWEGPVAVASFQTSQISEFQELKDDGWRKSSRDEHDLILLPKQLWCSLCEGNDGETCAEVGWVFNHGHAITSGCIFSSNADLKAIAIGREAAVSK